MQIRHYVLSTFLLLIAIVPDVVFAQSTTGPKQWLADYGFARQEAKRLGMPLLIHFSASWCGPCQQMERETLNTKALLETVGTQLVALKLDSDENPGLVDAFRVESLPSDVIVAPNGKIVFRTSGYQPTQRYLANVRHWSTQFPDERAAAIAQLTPPPTTSQPNPSQSPSIPIQQAPVIAGPQRPSPSPTIVQRPETASPAARLVGLSGYSPVAIKTRRVWTKGREDLAMTWQGVVYYLANDREYLAFKNAPHRYAPRMLGCDPVLLWNSDRAVQGAVEYGAFYDGDLYLFTTADTRDRFKVNPDQFVTVRHVLNPEEVVGTRIR
jgi:YHS domain-containing protein/thioredoxin-related protein